MNSKLPEVGLTIFSEMTNLAMKHNAINLSQGFPDFDTHPELKELVAQHIRAGHNQYAPMHGVAALRERIALKVRSLYGAEYDPEAEITVTTGGTEAIYSAVTAVIHPGDEAIIVEPAYDCYAPIVRLSGGRPVYAKLTFPDYRMDWDAFRNRVSARTRLVVLNFPHNPTGAVLNAADLDTLAEILRPTRALVLSDEVYEHIVFDGVRHQGMIGHPELRERSFVVGSFAKTYHTTGWKVGYCLAPRALTPSCARSTSTSCSPSTRPSSTPTPTLWKMRAGTWSCRTSTSASATASSSSPARRAFAPCPATGPTTRC